MKKMDPKREAAIQSVAELIFGFIRDLPSPADGAAALAMAQCALIWSTQAPQDEAHVRKLLGFTVEGIVEIWKIQRQAIQDNAVEDHV